MKTTVPSLRCSGLIELYIFGFRDFFQRSSSFFCFEIFSPFFINQPSRNPRVSFHQALLKRRSKGFNSIPQVVHCQERLSFFSPLNFPIETIEPLNSTTSPSLASLQFLPILRKRADCQCVSDSSVRVQDHQLKRERKGKIQGPKTELKIE